MSTSSLYAETTTTGAVTSYRRAYYIRVSNPVNGTPFVTFVEETATTLPDGTIITSPIIGPELSTTISDLTASFPLLDPTTGAATGTTATYAQVYSLLYSCYLSAATARDAASAAS